MKKILLFASSDSHFYHHLMPIALAMKAKGYDICIMCCYENHYEDIKDRGFDTIKINFARSSINPILELINLIKICFKIHKFKPDILCNFTLKPIIYGGLASIFLRKTKLINCFLGMGLIFTSDKFIYRIIKLWLVIVMKFIAIFKNVKYIAQNSDDCQLLKKLKIASYENIHNQCSVGIDLQKFSPQDFPPSDKIIFTFVGRMLKDKGILEFIEAAKILKQTKINAEFWLCGAPDADNKTAIKESLLLEEHAKGNIKYLGHINDIASIWKQSHVAVLPSYREGLSRSLLEAGACKRASITTDAPGGRDLIKHGEDGLLIKVKDVTSLFHAMKTLAEDKSLRENFAAKICAKVHQNYDDKTIAKKMMKIIET